MRYRLRTLLIALAILPPVVAAVGVSVAEYVRRHRLQGDAHWEMERLKDQLRQEQSARSTPGGLMARLRAAEAQQRDRKTSP